MGISNRNLNGKGLRCLGLPETPLGPDCGPRAPCLLAPRQAVREGALPGRGGNESLGLQMQSGSVLEDLRLPSSVAPAAPSLPGRTATGPAFAAPGRPVHGDHRHQVSRVGLAALGLCVWESTGLQGRVCNPVQHSKCFCAHLPACGPGQVI